MEIKLPQYIAHRGLSAKAPENTLVAFERALQAGYTMFECDVQLTQDNIPIIFHDEYLNRTTNGKSHVQDVSYAMIQTLDAGDWFAPEFKNERIPTLTCLLSWLKQNTMSMNLELKGLDGEVAYNQKLARFVAETLQPELGWLKNRLLISGFQYEALLEFKTLCPEAPLGVLISKEQFHSLGFAGIKARVKTLNAFTLNLDLALMTPANIIEFLKISPRLLVYTVPLGKAKALLQQGITSVFTNG